MERSSRDASGGGGIGIRSRELSESACFSTLRWSKASLARPLRKDNKSGRLHHHLCVEWCGRGAGAMSGDPLHARGLRGRNSPGQRCGRCGCTHPRSVPGRETELPGRGVSSDYRRDPFGSPRYRNQLLDGGGWRAHGGARASHHRARAGARCAEYGLDELCEVFARAQSARIRSCIRQSVFRHHLPSRTDEFGRRETGVRMLRHRTHRQRFSFN
jgi:hypothetical protein